MRARRVSIFVVLIILGGEACILGEDLSQPFKNVSNGLKEALPIYEDRISLRRPEIYLWLGPEPIDVKFVFVYVEKHAREVFELYYLDSQLQQQVGLLVAEVFY